MFCGEGLTGRSWKEANLILYGRWLCRKWCLHWRYSDHRLKDVGSVGVQGLSECYTVLWAKPTSQQSQRSGWFSL